MLRMTKEVLDINCRMYWCLKDINSASRGLTDNQQKRMLELLRGLDKSGDNLAEIRLKAIGQVESSKIKEKASLLDILDTSDTLEKLVCLRLALFALKFKKELLRLASCLDDLVLPEAVGLCRLSLAYDDLGVKKSYFMRVKGSLTVFKFFEYIDNRNQALLDSILGIFAEEIVDDFAVLKSHGLRLDQMYMLMFADYKVTCWKRLREEYRGSSDQYGNTREFY